MPYLPTAVLAAVGVLILVAMLVRTLAVLRRFARDRTAVQAGVADATGLLRARSAALRVAVAERRTPRTEPSTDPRTIDGQGRQEGHRG